MYRIVFIIDEMADIMTSAKKDVELHLSRLAAKSRAVGIHAIVATQRPDVKVITGTIKANFPTRIAFKTVSHIDSRTILDTMGAESLLGHGDMLFKPQTADGMQRIQGAMLSDKEVELRNLSATEASSIHIPLLFRRTGVPSMRV